MSNLWREPIVILLYQDNDPKNNHISYTMILEIQELFPLTVVVWSRTLHHRVLSLD
jgi:hypothetical protein